jgi:hypothetical protein
VGRSRTQATPAQAANELPTDIRPALLQALHILTRDGALNADSRRKLKQVNHLLGLLAPALEETLARHDAPVVVDGGAGKGYLGFLLAERFLRPAGRGTVLNVEPRAELCTNGKRLAEQLGLPGVTFVESTLETATLPGTVHMLTALHACDTATDDALVAAVTHGAEHVAVVPCCQAEVARQLKETRDGAALSALHAHPIHRREFGAHLTNVIRALALEASGYQVTVTELVGWEHSLKNELILGRKVQKDTRVPRQQLGALLEATGVVPKVVRVLRERGALAAV